MRISERGELLGDGQLSGVDPSVWTAFPVAEMFKRGWFEDFSGSRADARKSGNELILQFFRNANAHWTPAALHRKSVRASGQVHEPAIAAWEARVLTVADRHPQGHRAWNRDNRIPHTSRLRPSHGSWGNGLKELIKKFRRLFAGLRDQRQACPALQYDLVGVVSLAAAAMVCGANGPTAIAAFGANIGPRVFRATRLVRVPSHDTIGRVLAKVDADALDRAVQSGQAIVAARQRLRRMALDGKVTRGSASPARGQQAASVVNAWDIDHRRTLATVGFPGPGQEIAAARALLQRPDLDLTGTLVSLDALHCNQETRDLIRRRGGDWLLPVKGNQAVLQADIAQRFPAVPPADALRSEERTHGRHDIRVVETVTDPRVVQEIAVAHACEGLATLGRITYHSTRRGRPPTTETCVFICARRLRPRAFRTAVREHWGVEASLHNRLNVGMGEDACRVRVGMGPAVFAILRRQALNVIDSLRRPAESVPAAIEHLKWWFASGGQLHAAA